VSGQLGFWLGPTAFTPAQHAQLDALFAGWGDDLAAEAQRQMLAAITAGTPPATLGRTLMDTLDGLTRQRAQVIARQESMQAYRNATGARYESSDVVLGWVWLATPGSSCDVCLALHGSEHPADEPMESHVGCRCTQAPIPRSYASILRDAGLSTDELPADVREQPAAAAVETGAAWLARQDADTVRAILGPSRAALVQSGDLRLRDLVRWQPTTTGRQPVRRPLAALRRLVKG
jgi:Phage Mu protein F like protein